MSNGNDRNVDNERATSLKAREAASITEPSFIELCRLISFEAVYRMVAQAYAGARQILSREQFAKGQFPCLADCDDLYEMAIHGKSLRLIFSKPAGGHGNGGGAKWP